jgi:hypothetical protein
VAAYSLGQPALGSSIGFDVSGTLGGYLELRKEEQSKVVGLTCHHVLLPPLDSKPSGKSSASYIVYTKLIFRWRLPNGSVS